MEDELKGGMSIMAAVGGVAFMYAVQFDTPGGALTQLHLATSVEAPVNGGYVRSMVVWCMCVLGQWRVRQIKGKSMVV